MWGKRKSSHVEEVSAASGTSTLPLEASANEEPLATQSVASLGTEYKLKGAEPSVTNGVDGMEAPAVPNRAAQGPTIEDIRFSVAFTRIVSILMRSPHYKHYALSDLEWLVLPPILMGQCAVMEAKVNGRQMPVAAALWASVSDEVDKRLSESVTTPIKLRPDEWRSGETLWLIDVIGDPRAIPLLLKEVQETRFKHRRAKTRAIGPNSKAVES